MTSTNGSTELYGTMASVSGYGTAPVSGRKAANTESPVETYANLTEYTSQKSFSFPGCPISPLDIR